MAFIEPATAQPALAARNIPTPISIVGRRPMRSDQGP